MKIIDEKGRLFGLISVIDIAVILVVAALVGCFYLKNTKTENIISNEATENKITYTLEIKQATKEEVDSFKEGDEIFSSEHSDENRIGTIKEISSKEAEINSQKLDGTFVKATAQNRYDIVLTVSANANISEDGNYIIDSIYELDQNKTHTLYTKYTTFSCVVKGIENEQ